MLLSGLYPVRTIARIPRSRKRVSRRAERVGKNLYEGAIQVEVAAGSAVPFDARGIHRELKRSGVRRRSLFFVYGTVEEARHSTISGWAREAEYAEQTYLESLPDNFRRAVEQTIAAVQYNWVDAR